MKRTALFSIVAQIISSVTATSPLQYPLPSVLDGNLAPLPLVIWHGLGDK